MPQGCENFSQACNIILGWHQHKSSQKEWVNLELKAVEETRAQSCGSFTQTFSHNIHSELKKTYPWARDTAAHEVYLSKVKECEKGRMFMSSLKGLGLPSNMPKLTQKSANLEEGVHQNPTMLIFSPWSSSFQNCEKINFYCLSQLTYASLSWQPELTNAFVKSRDLITRAPVNLVRN